MRDWRFAARNGSFTLSAQSRCTGSARVTGGPDMADGQWLTYAEAGVRLGVTPEAARRRAIRRNWARMPAMTGRTRVLVPDDRLDPPRTPRTPDVRPDSEALVHALQAHVETLKAELAAANARTTAAEARADTLVAELATIAKAMARDRAGSVPAVPQRARRWWPFRRAG